MQERKTYSAREISDYIKSWESSGQSQKVFSKEHGIVYTTFTYWIRRYKKEIDKKVSGFIPIKISNSLSSVMEVEMLLPNGAKVIFHQPVEAEYLRKLLY